MKKIPVILGVLCLVLLYALLPTPSGLADHIECSLLDMTPQEFDECDKQWGMGSLFNEDSIHGLLNRLQPDFCATYAGTSGNALVSCVKASVKNRFVARCHHFADPEEAVQCMHKVMREYYE